MDKRDFGDWGVKLGALALATFVWFHAVTELSYERDLDIPLVVDDPPFSPTSGDLMVANRTPPLATVVVSGKGKDLLRLNGEEFLLRVQPSAGRGGAHLSFRLAADQVEVPAAVDVRVEEVREPKEVEVVLDNRIEREVEVRPYTSLVIADLHTLVGGIRVQPDRVRVSGPARHVEDLDFVHTDSLVLTGIHEDVETVLELHVPPGMRLTLSSTRVTLTLNIQELAEDKINNVPVTVRNEGRRRFSAEPSRVAVKVRGGADVIFHLDGETDIGLFVDYTAWRDGGSDGTVLVDPSDNFEVLQITPSRVSLVER